MADLRPAILGGTPLATSPIRLVRPVLPEFATLAADVEQTLISGMVTKGQHLVAFEQAVAAHLGVAHAIAVSSCTTGLALVYRALGLNGPVIVPSFTFMATVSALIWAGATPRFVEIDPTTTNIDLDAVRAALTPDVQAIVAVHNFGNPAAIAELEAIAADAGIPLIFDAAHGFGAQYDGRPVGGFGTAECFSLSPTKLLIAGEGGIVATNNDELAHKIRTGREYGNDGKYGSDWAGLNARMAEYNAIMGRYSLEQLEQAARQRNQYAALYWAALFATPGIDFQKVRPNDRCSYKDYSITIEASEFGISRDLLSKALAAEGIDSRAYYDPPVHRHAAYAQFAPTEGSLPKTDWLAQSSLSLPIHSEMEFSTIETVCAAIKRIQLFGEEIIAKQ
ncbi:MAG TPA: DegT/DnrJ/EryC1/StrS family aminotransferase [Herpetosiphon sp.]|uniref:DegT/DnrJ/EryC1/StrS aminotransferase n=1 Tax=Herpetosiphon aurantiacus (strain ATCC 23779 / DSM 785 / 114-95) TaxID=316274 RepID=A9AY72_HERA2|nr:DegT/DnrJ/EryC1/StrS family aminotransferase [Herpetosiphon sp.]ABX06954.1 DegT/DnrJ/EryC1/StrS aminotransferase [Herpetosiphon aurantiacus DSM 785]HBW52738.1 DegT/DnrJ/EryC1/StrS family aminotransferase [Herpetosiphon sp.]